MNKRQFLASSLAAAVGTTAASSATAQGEARSMVKLVFLLNRRPGMVLDDFRRYWRDEHSEIGAALPGLRKYVQNHVTSTIDGSLPPCDGFAELWFDDLESLNRALTSPEGQAAMVDSENFLDVERIQTFVVEEVTII
jgi:uncharacterized protein (TIGR02118 family)